MQPRPWNYSEQRASNTFRQLIILAVTLFLLLCHGEFRRQRNIHIVVTGVINQQRVRPYSNVFIKKASKKLGTHLF